MPDGDAEHRSVISIANLRGFAPHMAQATLSSRSGSHLVHVLYREVPFILNICARGVPFILNIKKGRLDVGPSFP